MTKCLRLRHALVRREAMLRKGFELHGLPVLLYVHLGGTCTPLLSILTQVEARLLVRIKVHARGEVTAPEAEEGKLNFRQLIVHALEEVIRMYTL
jgi:hypothetical protein